MRTSVPVYLYKYKHLGTAKAVKHENYKNFQVKFFDR